MAKPDSTPQKSDRRPSTWWPNGAKPPLPHPLIPSSLLSRTHRDTAEEHDCPPPRSLTAARSIYATGCRAPRSLHPVSPVPRNRILAPFLEAR